jgi:ComF family protein
MFDSILSIIFPEHCRGCNKAGTAICRQCLSFIEPAPAVIELPHAVGLWNYQNPIVRKAIWELKYHHTSPAAKLLTLQGTTVVTDFLAELLQSTHGQDMVLVPIPQHYTKTYERGFNQSRLMATWLQKIIPGASIQSIVKKTRATHAQAHAHNRQQRQENLQGSMKVAGTASPHALYIVVDDVITTGSTIREASRALRAAGANHICAIALAHGELR